MDNKETGFETPEHPILCINNCGFFGNPATMNMCCNCHKALVMKQEHAKFTAASIDSIVNGGIRGSNGKETFVMNNSNLGSVEEEFNVILTEPSGDLLPGKFGEKNPEVANLISKQPSNDLIKFGDAKPREANVTSTQPSTDLILCNVGDAKPEAANLISNQPSSDLLPDEVDDIVKVDMNPKGPNRCSACRKRVGLTGFTCRCGHLFCGVHRYSEKHNCRFDYRTAARDAISKANPVIKSQKIHKI